MCLKYGEIEEMNVCDNLGDHLVGNVYIKYRREEDAEKACKVLNTRWYDGMYSLCCVFVVDQTVQQRRFGNFHLRCSMYIHITLDNFQVLFCSTVAERREYLLLLRIFIQARQYMQSFLPLLILEKLVADSMKWGKFLGQNIPMN